MKKQSRRPPTTIGEFISVGEQARAESPPPMEKSTHPPARPCLTQNPSSSSLRGLEQSLLSTAAPMARSGTPLSAVSPFSSPAGPTPSSVKSDPVLRENSVSLFNAPRLVPQAPVKVSILCGRKSPVSEGRRLAVDYDKPLPMPGPIGIAEVEAVPITFNVADHASRFASVASPTRRSSVYDWIGTEEKQVVGTEEPDMPTIPSAESLASPSGGDIPITFDDIKQHSRDLVEATAELLMRKTSNVPKSLTAHSSSSLPTPPGIYLQSESYAGSSDSLAKKSLASRDASLTLVISQPPERRNPELQTPTLNELVDQSRILDDFNRNSVLITNPIKPIPPRKPQIPQLPFADETVDLDALPSSTLPPVIYDSSEDGSREEFPLRPAPLRTGQLKTTALTKAESEFSGNTSALEQSSRFSSDTEDDETTDILPLPSSGLRRKRSLVGELLRRSVKPGTPADNASETLSNRDSKELEPWRFQKAPEYWGAEDAGGNIPSSRKLTFREKFALRAQAGAKSFKEGLKGLEREELEPLNLRSPRVVSAMPSSARAVKKMAGEVGERVKAWPKGRDSGSREEKEEEERRERLKAQIRVLRENEREASNRWV